jgi:hypothetical protein
LEIETMNKFDALKMFQGWPPDWQRLCAECWIETGEVEPTKVSTFGERLESAKKLLMAQESVQAKISARLEQDQPKAAKVAAARPARNQMRYTRDELTEVDSHVSEGRGPSEIARIMDKKYPRQRTIDAWEKMANRIKKVGLQAMLGRAVDVEFK